MVDKVLFSELKKTLDGKKDFRKKMWEIYKGEFSPKTLGVSINPHFETAVKEDTLPWGTVAVDKLLSDLRFNFFDRDTFGLSKLFEVNDAYTPIDSAIKHALISAVSFVAVFPVEETGGVTFRVYHSGQSTAKFSSKQGRFVSVLVENTVVKGKVEDYLLFEVGKVTKVSKDGKEIDSTDTGLNMLNIVPFVYRPDFAQRPFGESRFNKSAISALRNGIITQKIISVGNDFKVAEHNLLFLKSEPDTDIDLRFNKALGTLPLMSSSTDAEILKFDPPNIDDTYKTIATYANQFASAVSMPPSSFGVAGINVGSASESDVNDIQNNYNTLVERCRLDFGKPIKELAFLVALLTTGKTEIDPEWPAVQPVYHEKPLDVKMIAQFGDALYKLKTSVPDFNFDSLIDKVLNNNSEARMAVLGEKEGVLKYIKSLEIDIADISNESEIYF